MQHRFMDFLTCPDCRSITLDLQIDEIDEASKEIEAGSITCGACQRRFAIESGIPRMLPIDLLAAESRVDASRPDGTLQTMASYDFHHQRQGHKAPDSHDADLEITRHYFRRYLDLDEARLQDLKNRLVLDAGSGAGRYLAIAQESGASEVVGLDLSAGGLLSARSLLKDARNGHML